jgi:hypothetical protein
MPMSLIRGYRAGLAGLALGQVAMALAIVALGNARAGFRPARAEAARATTP